jgi:hypothetical protein
MQTNKTTGRFALAASFLALGAHSAGATEAPGSIPTVEVPHEISLVANGDADVQGGAPQANYGGHTVMHIGNQDKTVFVHFDLREIPEGATVTEARLVMNVVGSGSGQNDVMLGAVTGNWRESKITYANQPETAWRTRTKTISAAGPVRWNVKAPVAAWVSGEHRNHGFAIRSTDQGPIWAFLSREGAPAESRPTLHIAYTTTGGVIEPPRSETLSRARKGTKTRNN